MLVVVNQPHTEGFRIEGNIPAAMIDYIKREYSKEDVSILEDEGDELLDPHEMDWFREAEVSASPGKNLRVFRTMHGMTQSQLAKKLGTTKQAISNMENGIHPISRKTALSLSKIFSVSVSNFIA